MNTRTRMHPIRNFPGNGWNEKTETRREDILEAAETMLFLPTTNNKRLTLRI